MSRSARTWRPSHPVPCVTLERDHRHRRNSSATPGLVCKAVRTDCRGGVGPDNLDKVVSVPSRTEEKELCCSAPLVKDFMHTCILLLSHSSSPGILLPLAHAQFQQWCLGFFTCFFSLLGNMTALTSCFIQMMPCSS